MTYLAKVGELTLKGSNIKEFENRLITNAKKYLSETNATVKLNGGRLYIECSPTECAQAEFTLSHLIGITGWAKTLQCEKDINEIKNTCYKLALKEKQNGATSFKLEARRQDKKFPLTSYEICREAAEKIVDENILTVNVHEPDVKIHIEVRDKCYIFSSSNSSPRGLPVGVSGKGLLLLSGGIDSPVAGYKMICRGMKIDCIYFHSYPYTSEEAEQKVETLAQTLSEYGIAVNLNVIPFTDVQMRIKEKSPSPWTTLLLRICMMKVANLCATRTGASCIITGESLGQVASQTIPNLTVTEHFAKFPLFRPLIATDKEDITKVAREIGSYETSILPYEDCCVLFSPKHPILKATVEEAEELYKTLEIENLIQESFEKRIIKHYEIGKACIKNTH